MAERRVARIRVGGNRLARAAACLLVFILAGHGRTLANEYNLRIEGVEAPVYTLIDNGEAVWIAAANGIFRWDHGKRNAPALQPNNTGQVYEIAASPDTIWFGADKGLFRWNKGSSAPPALAQSIPEVYAVAGERSTVWIGTNRSGVYRWNQTAPPKPILSPFQTSWINDILIANDTVWIGAHTGLYISHTSSGLPQRLPVVTGAVYKIRNAGDSVWFAAENGLFRYRHGDRLPPTRVPLDTGWVNDIYATGNTIWFGAQKGVFVLSGTATLPIRFPIDLKRVYTVRETSCCLWFGTDNSLFRSPKSSRPEAILQLRNTGKIYNIVESATTLWVASDEALYRVERSDRPWTPSIQFSKMPQTITEGQDLVIRWQLRNTDWRVPLDVVKQRVLIIDKRGRLLNQENAVVEQGRSDYIATGLQPGDYTVTIEATDLFGNVARSPARLLRVSIAPLHPVIQWLRYLGLLYTTINLLAFIGLTLASRWSYRCFVLLTDPLVRRLSLYFGAAVKYVTPIRVWIFERYYKGLQADFPKQNYLETLVKYPDGSYKPAATLQKDILKIKRVWIQGAPGTGKTELTREFMRQYVRYGTLKRAFAAAGYIPILIPLRNYIAQDAIELIREALTANAMPFDANFLENLLRTGGFVVIFDGLNESRLEAEILRFCNVYAEVRVVITSQTLPIIEGFSRFSLPSVTGAFAKRLLPLLAPNVPPQKMPVASAHVWEDIESAYDVLLIANLLISGQQVPTDRLQLYDATIAIATSESGGDALRSVISRLAWRLWKEGQHRFDTSPEVTTDILSPFLEMRVVVRRGDMYEFRHDLMRGYLAAWWIMSSGIDIAFDRLSEDELWRLSAAEQNTVFPFLAALCQTPDELVQLFAFAASQSGQRERLIVATVEESKRRRYGWSVAEQRTGTRG